MSDIQWKTVKEYKDITFKKSEDGIARIAINRDAVDAKRQLELG